MKKIRYYLHGDKHELKDEYYCAFCDIFYPDFGAHIQQDSHKRYLDDKKRFKLIKHLCLRPSSADRSNWVA